MEKILDQTVMVIIGTIFLVGFMTIVYSILQYVDYHNRQSKKSKEEKQLADAQQLAELITKHLEKNGVMLSREKNNG